MQLRISAIFCLLLLAAGCNSTDRSLSRELAEADALARDLKYAQAITVYDRIIPRIADANRSADAYTKMGEAYLGSGQAELGYRALLKAVETHPTHIPAHIRLIELYIASGSHQHALPHIALILAKDPQHALALSYAGMVRIQQSEVDKGKALLRNALKSDPSTAQAAISLAEVLNIENNVPEARAILAAAGNASRTDPAAWLALGRLEEQEGNADAAEAAYRAAVKRGGGAHTDIRLAQFLQRNARMEEAESALRSAEAKLKGAHALVPDLQIISGRPLAAARGYMDALQKHDDPILRGDSSPSQRASLAAKLITAHLQSSIPGSTAAARSVLKRYQSELETPILVALQAEIEMAEGNLAAAVKTSAFAVSLSPTSASARYIHGVALQRIGRFGTAKAQWNAALDLDPDHYPSRLALAERNLLEGDAVTAEQHVTQVVREEPANVEALHLYARVLIAQERMDAARNIAQRARTVDSGDPAPYALQGDIYSAEKKVGRALAEYERALRLEPRYLPAIAGLENIYSKSATESAAIRRFEKTARSQPESSVLLQVAGRLYARRGMKADAIRVFTSVLQADPQNQDVAGRLAGLYEGNGRLPFAGGAQPPAVRAILQALESQRGRRYDDAIRQYELALKHGESSGIAANNLAWIYAERGKNLERALQLAASASDQDPENPAMLDTLGVVLLKKRDYSAAVAVLSKAAALSAKAGPGISAEARSSLFRHLAEAHSFNGEPEAAERALRQAR